ncbi:hypothetical protein [Sedimentimonas flavescens]|uniref:hypothetical protein n=1 Tax=Sedimentimonas flavescens TaxID=2851012 RepID=UPI001C49FB47|nr:hypothetical protein [Sedimentimonas flavescens]MBW0158395.1 hypothetical protein [Sedimentimonas flavescens]
MESSFFKEAYLKYYLQIVGVLLVMNFAIHLLDPDSYQLSEWGINSSGGFVRRGISGDILIFLAEHLRVPINVLAFVFLLPLIFIWWRSYFIFSLSTSRNPWVWPLIFSPAFMLPYAVSDFAGHKEILIFALYAFVIFKLDGDDARRFKAIVIGLYFLPVIILVHEGLVAWTPYFFATLVSVSISRTRVLLLLPALVAMALALTFALTYRGSEEHALAACEVYKKAFYLFSNSASDCGAIDALSGSARKNMKLIIFEIGSGGTKILLGSIAYFLPIAIFLLATSPWRYLPTRRLVFVFACFGASVAMTAAMMLVAFDWGRFLAIHVTLLAFSLLSLVKNKVLKFDAALAILRRLPDRGWLAITIVVCATWFPTKFVTDYMAKPLLFFLPAVFLLIWLVRDWINRKSEIIDL